MFEQARRIKARYNNDLPFVGKVKASHVQEWGERGRLVGLPPRRDAPIILFTPPFVKRYEVNVRGWYAGPDLIFNLARNIETINDFGEGSRYTILQWTAEVVADDTKKLWTKGDRTFENFQTKPTLCAMLYRVQKYWTPIMLRLDDVRKEYLLQLLDSLKPYQKELEEIHRKEVCSTPQQWGCLKRSDTKIKYSSHDYPLWRTKTLGAIWTRI